MKRYDVYSQFARRHLGTPEERALYLSLVAQEADSWSIGELVGRTHLDPSATERVLRSFEDAGVVEGTDTAEGRRYRWRSDMHYLFGNHEEDSAERVDPVCGMPVLLDSPHTAKDTFGRLRSFCSSLCLSVFRAAPGAFSGAAPLDVRAVV